MESECVPLQKKLTEQQNIRVHAVAEDQDVQKKAGEQNVQKKAGEQDVQKKAGVQCAKRVLRFSNKKDDVVAYEINRRKEKVRYWLSNNFEDRIFCRNGKQREQCAK